MARCALRSVSLSVHFLVSRSSTPRPLFSRSSTPRPLFLTSLAPLFPGDALSRTFWRALREQKQEPAGRSHGEEEQAPVKEEEGRIRLDPFFFFVGIREPSRPSILSSTPRFSCSTS